MDDYQRDKLSHLPLDWECRWCVSSDYMHLPQHLLQAVQQGDIKALKDYINNDGSVNALHEGESLLSKACSEGQVEIVKFLLGCPGIHLNAKFEERSPLGRAFGNGHLECVKLLVDSTTTCNVYLGNDWEAAVKCLNMQHQLHHRSATRLLRCAMKDRKWDVLNIILEMKYHFVKDDLYGLALAAIHDNTWDIVFKILKRDFYGKSELTNEVLAIAVNMRDWKNAAEVLLFIDSDFRFKIPFVEAALGKRLPEAQKLLEEGQYDPGTLNGNLLVVVAGEIDKPVAELLMDIKNVYTKKAFVTALFLAAWIRCEESFSRLLHNPEASYSLNDLHQIEEILTRQQYRQKRTGPIVTYFSNYLQESFKIKEATKYL